MWFVSAELIQQLSSPQVKRVSGVFDVHHPEDLHHGHLCQHFHRDFVLRSHQRQSQKLRMMELEEVPCPCLGVPIDYGDVIMAGSVHPLVHSFAVAAFGC